MCSEPTNQGASATLASAKVWAFIGENESRKNYFRALIVWCLLLTALWVTIMTLGFWPEIQKLVASWFPQSQ